VKCYGPDYKKHQDIVDFVQAVIRAFKMFPTYDFLASAGIVPSNTTAYKLADIQGAIYRQTGALPYLGCAGKNHTVLDEVWYYGQHVSSIVRSCCGY
jgi:ribonuclease T2